MAVGETEDRWVVPFADGARGQGLNYDALKSASALNGLKNNESGPTNAAQLIVPTFVYDFEAGDKRKWVTVAPFEWIVDNGDGVSSSLDKKKLAFADWDGTGKVCYQKKRDIDGFYLGKYRVEWMVRNRNGNDDGIDYPVMRYADVLLMYAEASIVGIEGNVPDGANAGDAQAQFDKIRTRAGLAPVALNMDNLMKERAFELCGEYVRKFDLMRWGKLKEALTTTMERIANLNAHTGEFAETSDYMWFKYKKNDDLLYQ